MNSDTYLRLIFELYIFSFSQSTFHWSLQCMHLLTSQLESQRKYWEEQVVKAEKAANSQRDEANKQLKLIVEKNAEIQSKVGVCYLEQNLFLYLLAYS